MPAAIRFTRTGDMLTGGFSVHAALRDAKGALVGGRTLFGRDVSLRFTPEKLAGFLASDNVTVRNDAKAPPPGTYELAVAVRDSSGWIAARSVPLTVTR